MSLPDAQSSLASKRRLLFVLDQLHELQEALTAAGVDWVLVKGAGLALWAWPDPFARPFSDIDIFVRPRGFGAAVRALMEIGYTPETNNEDLPMHWTLHRQGQLTVELHHDFTREWTCPRELLDAFCDNAMHVDTGSFSLPLPAPGRHLAFVLLHAYNHGWITDGVWVEDVRYILERAPEALLQALAFFPESWPVQWSLAVAAAQDSRIPADSLSLSARCAGQWIARALKLRAAGLPAQLSLLLRVAASAHPVETLARMAARFNAHRASGLLASAGTDHG